MKAKFFEVETKLAAKRKLGESDVDTKSKITLEAKRKLSESNIDERFAKAIVKLSRN